MKTKKSNKKLNKRKFIFFIIILVVIYIQFFHSNNSLTASNVKVNYSGLGQVKVYNKNGYTTTFTTVDENKKTYIEYKQNLGTWKDLPYWDNKMWDEGCGITALSIILSGYGKNVTPDDLRKEYYPVLSSDNMPKVLRDKYDIGCSDFYYNSRYFTKDYIVNWLKSNRPILICVTNTPENVFTTASHYMVLLATDGEDMVYVSNPNGEDGSNKASGWYNTSQVLPSIAKAIFIEEK